jgi:hypothetical protein
MQMKADVQYNDYLGTSAADISDHTDLNKLLKRFGVDTSRYNAIGAELYAGYDTYFSVYIFAEDKSLNPLKVEKFEVPLSPKQFFKLFKRLDVVLLEKHSKYTPGDFKTSSSIQLGDDVLYSEIKKSLTD